MALVANRRPVMTLYSGTADPHSHRARLALAEKNIAADIIIVGENNLPEDLIDLNPYHSVPTLVDRDLALYDAQVIMEYLDERYPHPPLMPVDPVNRARTRLFLYRIERDWYRLLPDVESKDKQIADKARKLIRDGLTSIAPIFEQKPFFMSDEYTLADCTMAPLLWRLHHYNIELTAQAKTLMDYAQRLFARPPFRSSLTAIERDMQK